ncbi:MAG: MCE family protein [Bauldia sp.]|nr:MAG: MCE family protein [Bauldia sp.]MBZ0228417.1 MlaD family protein [Bauldia sp.]
METRAKYVTIGVFTLFVIVLAFGFIYWLKRLDETGIRSAVLFKFAGTVGGLAPGGAVFFAGIKVGNVTNLAFDREDPNLVLVTAEVRQDTPIKTDTKAVVGANLLTGVAYIDMTGGSPDAPSVFSMETPTIIGSKSGLGDVVAAAESVVSKVDSIVDRVDRFLANNEASLKTTVDNVETFTDALAENADGVKDFLANVSEMSKTISGLSERLNGLVDKADKVVAAIEPEKVRSAVDNAEQFVKRLTDASADVQGIVDNVKSAVDQITEFSGGLGPMLDDVRRVVAGVDAEKIATVVDNVTAFSDKLKASGPDIDLIIADAKATAANVNDFTANLTANEDNLNQIVADAKELAQRLNESSKKLDAVLGKADDFLGGAEGEGGRNFFQEATDAAKAIREAAQSVSKRVDEVAVGLTKFSGRGLDNISALVGDLRATAARIDRAVAEFERNPSGIVFGGNSGVREYNRR